MPNNYHNILMKLILAFCCILLARRVLRTRPLHCRSRNKTVQETESRFRSAGYYGTEFRSHRVTNDRIATQRYLTPEIPIGSPVMSRTTSEPSGGRSRKMVSIVAGCRSFRTFRDCHTSIAFTTVGAQPNLAHIFG